MQTKLLKKKTPAPQPVTRSAVEKQLSWAAVEGNRFQHRDPLAQVTESFQQTFDQMGQRRTEQLTVGGGAGVSKEKQTQPGSEEAAQALSSRKRPGAHFHAELPQTPIQTFSEMAFQRGRLASAVLQGTGRMMLATCLQHSVGQQSPVQSRQTLFGAGTQVRVVPGSSPDQMVFHRGFARSAVGLVVDVLSDARSVVDTLAEMAGGTGTLEENEGAQTLRQVYPFLDDSREQELLDQYRAQLAGTTGVEERQVLQNAIVHAEALITRKAQMKNEFITKLRLISDKAEEALEELQSEDTIDFLTAALGAASLAEPPELPPEPPDDGEGDGRSKKNRGRVPEQKEAVPDGTEQPDGEKHPEGTEQNPAAGPQSEAGTEAP